MDLSRAALATGAQERASVPFSAAGLGAAENERSQQRSQRSRASADLRDLRSRASADLTDALDRLGHLDLDPWML